MDSNPQFNDGSLVNTADNNNRIRTCILEILSTHVFIGFPEWGLYVHHHPRVHLISAAETPTAPGNVRNVMIFWAVR